MQTSLFSFDLPDELIAQEPPKQRGTCRLMVMNRQPPEASSPGSAQDKPRHMSMGDFPGLLEPGSVVVFNDTRVRKARMFAENMETGGKGEFLFIQPTAGGDWDCVVDRAKKKKEGQRWRFPGGREAAIISSPATDRRVVRFDLPPGDQWFEEYGHIPLPPYMRRPDSAEDAARYQTVYARETGSAAAPTAGLHFTTAILDELRARGIIVLWVTLEVGLGTFAPVRAENITDHPMHTEKYRVPRETALEINKARKEGRKVIGVGTTSVRTLEASWKDGELVSGEGRTNLFIYPGYKFKVVDAIFTNFHTPKSTLLMMISAFCGRERLLTAYQEAVEKGYKFFSYGDAMFVK